MCMHGLGIIVPDVVAFHDLVVDKAIAQVRVLAGVSPCPRRESPRSLELVLRGRNAKCLSVELDFSSVTVIVSVEGDLSDVRRDGHLGGAVQRHGECAVHGEGRELRARRRPGSGGRVAHAQLWLCVIHRGIVQRELSTCVGPLRGGGVAFERDVLGAERRPVADVDGAGRRV